MLVETSPPSLEHYLCGCQQDVYILVELIFACSIISSCLHDQGAILEVVCSRVRTFKALRSSTIRICHITPTNRLKAPLIQSYRLDDGHVSDVVSHIRIVTRAKRVVRLLIRWQYLIYHTVMFEFRGDFDNIVSYMFQVLSGYE